MNGPKRSRRAIGETPYLLPIRVTLTLLKPPCGSRVRTRMHRVALVALLAAAPALAHAHDADEHEKPTAVTATLVGTTVRMKARFAFDVEGPAVGLNSHAFAIPASAMVTSGSVIVDGKRHALELKKADDASRAFDGLTLKPGAGKNRSWVFLVDGGSSLVTLDVLAPKTANVVLELSLEAPTCFFKDRRLIELPTSWWQRVANHGHRRRSRDHRRVRRVRSRWRGPRALAWVCERT